MSPPTPGLRTIDEIRQRARGLVSRPVSRKDLALAFEESLASQFQERFTANAETVSSPGRPLEGAKERAQGSRVRPPFTAPLTAARIGRGSGQMCSAQSR
jgi:hypothetical protein